jgi:hypothetical protein
MSDHQSLIKQQHIPADDGWDDAAAEASERVIRGRLLKYNDRRFLAGQEETLVKDGTRLVALQTVAMWVRWEARKPVEHIVRRPGERLPERDKLSYTDEIEWPIGSDDEPKDPWANTRLVYLVDPDTAEAFTFSTSSWGGRSAVIELGDAIARMRSAHPNAAPIVELRAADMRTKHGLKSKPAFKIVGWKNANVRPAETAKASTNAQPIERPRTVFTSGRQALASPEPPPSGPPIEVYDGPDAIDDSIP